MTLRKMVIRRMSSTTYKRRQSLRRASPSSSSTGKRIAEMAGGTTAACAAVWCCCPCTLVNLLVLVVYRFPARICKKAMRMHRRRRMVKKGLLPLPSSSSSSRGSARRCSSHLEGIWSPAEEVNMVAIGGSNGSDENFIVMDKELMQWEEEMWDRFYTTGFWRSPSQREKKREQQQ